MWPVKSTMKSSHMWSVEPAMLQSTYKMFSQAFFCDDKNCQSTTSVCDDKNCQSTKCVHMQKPPMTQSSSKKGTQSTHLWSVSKTAGKQLGTQPEVPRNIKHTGLPVHNQQIVSKDSTIKCCYPSVSTNVCPDTMKMQSNHMQPVKAELKKSQVNTRSQVQTSNVKETLSPRLNPYSTVHLSYKSMD